MFKFSSLIFTIAFLCSNFVFANSISIDSYVDQVRKVSPALHGAELGAEAHRTQANDTNLLFLPTLDFVLQEHVSKQDTYVPQIYGSKNTGFDYKVSVSEQTNFGLTGRLFYNVGHTDTVGASTQYMPVPTYYTTQPGIELSQSLWRNGFGAEARAGERAKRFSAESSYYQDRFKYQAALVEAKGSYLQLMYLRKSLAALRSSLEFASKLRDWSKSRAQNELGDKSDFLQTEAFYEQRELDLIKNETELKNASQIFNSLRGVDSDAVAEDLAEAPPPALPQVDLKKLTKLDTMAGEMGLEAAKANSKINQEIAQPTLDVFASFAYTDNDLNLSRSEANFGHHPVYAYGLKFSTSLDFTKAYRISRSFAQEIESSEYYLRRQKIDEARDLSILVRRLYNAHDRLKLAEKIENSQTTKLNTERERHRRGRTTLFQVLQFEQDHVSAQLNRINTELEYRSLLNQLDLYEVSSESNKTVAATESEIK